MGASSDAVSDRRRLPATHRHPGVSSVSARCHARKSEVQLVERSEKIPAVLLPVRPVIVHLYRNHTGQLIFMTFSVSVKPKLPGDSNTN